MRQIVAGIAIGAAILLPSTLALGANVHLSTGSTGQPSQTCGQTTGPATPGGTATQNSPGSAFNGGGVADSVYAGTPTQISRSGGNANGAAVAQYDVACFQVNQIP